MGDYVIHAGGSEIAISYGENSVAIYNLTVDIIRDTKVNSSEGISITPVTLVNLMPCHIKWLSGREKLLFNKDTHLLDGLLFCRKPVGVTIVNSDRVLYNSEYYEITDVRDVNNLGILLYLSIKKVK